MTDIKTLIALSEKIAQTEGSFLSTEEVPGYRKIIEDLYEIQADALRKIVDRVGSDTFVKLAEALESIIVERLGAQGRGNYLVEDMMKNNDLELYTHYLVLTVLGMSIREEIL